MSAARLALSFPWRWAFGAFDRALQRAVMEAKRKRARVLCEHIAAHERGRNIARHDGACTCLRCQVRRFGSIG